MKVLAITGKPGSGKTTAINAIRDLGMVITMGDVVRNEVRNRNLELSDNNIGKIAKILRKEKGLAVIAEKCIEVIKNKSADVIFVDGIRSTSEVNLFRKLWKFPIIAIVIDERVRFNRLLERARSDDPKILEELIERDKRESQFGLDEVLQNADYIIHNNSTIDDLKRNVRDLVLNIIKNY
jgi:dephospho-CoA kinase